MEQTFKKKGGGTMRLKNGRKIKPGQVFKCDRSEIPEAFLDLLEVQYEEKPKADNFTRGKKGAGKKESEKKTELIPSEEEEGLFDVYLIEGKEKTKVNEEPLDEDAANALIETL